ncbi:DUF3344 domain-containing protein [Streptomyces gobiensis]|uniref:DUF3344 domain-containing protein n=1 Tax=Streptomyces gobiensis TaxID=2875706 RepID=UPI001E4354C6|nr:DUF3344 domain-containing protein [Streptomyces gobiensis]UGY90540.1 DUF3344 domain-containing protein [Streptomyces gobiensis]
MRMPMGLAGRGVLCALTSLALALPSAVAAPQQSPRVPFGQRYGAVQHGGIVRAANSSITCRSVVGKGASSCEAARRGAGVNGAYEMSYVDVDNDPNTYNSSRARLRVPSGSRVSYARLYWGGNLRVGEQKPPEDNGRVLIAEPGGDYKEVLADSLIGHRTTRHTDGFQASADVTGLVRHSGSGYYTVAQVNVAMGKSKAGAWGGWTLVVAYENQREPLRHLAIWDGFESLTTGRKSFSIDLGGMSIPPKASGSVGVVAYNGDRGTGNDVLTVNADGRKAVRLRDAANPVNDVMNSTIADHGRNATGRQPAYENTLGYDSDVFDIKPALKAGGSRLHFRFGTRDEGYQTGALFVQADARH